MSSKPDDLGPSSVVAAILARMPRPDEPINARTATWHSAFFQLRGEFGDRLPGLRKLRFHTRPGLPPISVDLEDILQNIAMWDMSSAQNPRLMLRKQDRERLLELTPAVPDGLIEEAAAALRHHLTA